MIKPEDVHRTTSAQKPGKSSAQDIEALVRSAQAGSSADRHELYQEFRALIAWHARKYASDVAAIDDISQEALMGFMRAIDTFDVSQGVQFNTYATTCISNAAISAARKIHTQDSHLMYEADSGISIEDFSGSGFEEEVLIRFAEKELNARLIIELTPLEYKAFSLRAKGYPPREIARELDTDVSSVNNALARARNKVKDLAE